MPAFGWSIGDCIASADLVLNTGSFIRTTHGASTEYHVFAKELQALRCVLEICQQVKQDDFHPVARAYLTNTLAECQNLLKKVSRELQTYESALDQTGDASIAKRMTHSVNGRFSRGQML